MIKPITFPMRPLNGGALDKPFAIIPPWPRAYEPKANGHRLLIHVPTSTVFNRHGELYSAAQDYSLALVKLKTHTILKAWEWLDCEGLSRRHGIAKGSIIVLDVIDLHDKPYRERMDALDDCFDAIDVEPLNNKPESVYRMPFYVQNSNQWLKSNWLQLQDCNGQVATDWRQHPDNAFWEGLVCKRLDSTYTIQLRSAKDETTAWTKHRFV